MKPKNGRSGQALLMATVSLFAMLGMMGLAVDLGYGYYRREAAQTASDAAAAAVIQAAMQASPGSQTCGTNSVWCGTPVGTAANCPATAPTTLSTAFDYGCKMAALNGFLTTGSQTVSIQANTTSTVHTVPGTTVSYWATVRITENELALFGKTALSSSTRSSAAIVGSSSSVSNNCLYLLNGTAKDALNMSNGVSVTTSSCGVYVNSNNSEAAIVTGGAVLHTTTFNSVGGVAHNNGGCIDTPTGGCNSLTATTNVTAIADPFLNLPSPSPTTPCINGNYTAWQPSAYQLSPGTYCNFNLSNGMSAVMAPGIYIINGSSGFNVANGGGTLTATGGVMIYLTGGAQVNIANGSSVTLSAQSSGPYEGVLFYQDRTQTAGTSTFAGGANQSLTGSLYFPKSTLNINNGSNTSTLGIVAGSVNFSGGATLKQATSFSQTGLGTAGSSSVAIIE
ncbi:MAG TPA: pilus assembly protein TadG-related protein [Bryobacteraceae bacterium]|nr:pilus assembly protein TadG-related protein [Bryobacteraceae bacterium]